jgi:hypothetical protein
MMSDFINRHKNLHVLRIYGDLFKDFEGLICQYQLKTLVVKNFYNHENLIKFLQLQKDNLQVLELSYDNLTIEAMEQIQKYVLNNLPNLKDLVLDLEFVGYSGEPAIEMSMNEPHHATYVTKNIERLGFDRYNRSHEENKRFVDMFPNIKHISVESNLDEDLHRLIQYISLTKPALESVNIDLEYYKNQPLIYFPYLKVLIVKQYFDEDLNSFIDRHSTTLEEIEVDCSFGIKKSTIHEINKCENLRKISFHPFEQKYLIQIIDALSKHLSINKSLEITFYYYPSSSVTFKLPEDAIFLKGDSIVKTEEL